MYYELKFDNFGTLYSIPLKLFSLIYMCYITLIIYAIYLKIIKNKIYLKISYALEMNH